MLSRYFLIGRFSSVSDMGNARSSYFEEKPDDAWWSTVQTKTSSLHESIEKVNEKKLSKESVRKLEEFKLELTRKREKRKQIISGKSKEMEELREEIQRLREENEALRRVQHEGQDDSDSAFEIDRLRQENETFKMLVHEKSRLLQESEKIIEKNRELRIETVKMQQELQRLNGEMLNFEKERQDYKAHVVALKDVIAVSKHMLQIRETELTEVSFRLCESSIVSFV